MSSCYSFKVQAVWGLMRRGHWNFYDVVLHWIFRLPRPVVFVNCFFIVCVYCNSFTDDRFVMKQMSKQELQCFLEFAPHYFRYVNKALDEQVCDHVTGCHYKCQAHTWNTYPLTPQPIRFNLQPFAPKFSLRRKEKSFKSPVKFVRGHGEFCGKATWPHAQSNGNVTQKFFANMCTVGDPGKGPGGPPPYFLTKLRPEGRKKVFWRPPPPPFISGSGWPGYTVVPKTFVRLISTKVGDVHHCPRRRGLPKRLLYLRIIDVENKWLLTFCYNVLICRLFLVLSLATDIVSKDLGYLQNRFQEPTVEPETRCAGHGELVLWSQNWQGKLLGVLRRTKGGFV